jgi:hypothetical protein
MSDACTLRAFTMTPQHHHAITLEISRNDRAAHQPSMLHQHHGAECMNLKYLATAAAIATLAATAAQAQTQTSPQPTQRMQQGSSTTTPHGKAGSASGTVGSANHAGSRSGKTVKPAPEGAMQHGGSTTDSDSAPSGTTPGGMSR